ISIRLRFGMAWVRFKHLCFGHMCGRLVWGLLQLGRLSGGMPGVLARRLPGFCRSTLAAGVGRFARAELKRQAFAYPGVVAVLPEQDNDIAPPIHSVVVVETVPCFTGYHRAGWGKPCSEGGAQLAERDWRDAENLRGFARGIGSHPYPPRSLQTTFSSLCSGGHSAPSKHARAVTLRNYNMERRLGGGRSCHSQARDNARAQGSS